MSAHSRRGGDRLAPIAGGRCWRCACSSHHLRRCHRRRSPGCSWAGSSSSLPVLLLLLASCTLRDEDCRWYCVGVRLLRWLSPAAVCAFPLYILHVPLDALLPRDANASPFVNLWWRPQLIVLGALAFAHADALAVVNLSSGTAKENLRPEHHPCKHTKNKVGKQRM